MARGRYQESADVRFLRRLVAYAEGDAKERPWTLMLDGEGLRGPAAAKAQAARFKSPESHAELQAELQAFLRFLTGGADTDFTGDWRFSVEIILLKYPDSPPRPGARKRAPGKNVPGLHMLIDTSLRNYLLYQVATSLARIGIDRLRRCPAPDCGRTFVKIGRREYCSERCQRRVFVSTYDPFSAKPQRKERQHGSQKTTPRARRR